MNTKSNLLRLHKLAPHQGHREGEAAGAVCPRASGSRGPHQLISKFLFKASLDVSKEPPNRSSLQGSKIASRFSSPDSLAFCPLLLASITETRVPILQFCPWASKTSRRPAPHRRFRRLFKDEILSVLSVDSRGGLCKWTKPPF